jgi:hypothetical protein
MQDVFGTTMSFMIEMNVVWSSLWNESWRGSWTTPHAWRKTRRNVYCNYAPGIEVVPSLAGRRCARQAPQRTTVSERGAFKGATNVLPGVDKDASPVENEKAP